MFVFSLQTKQSGTHKVGLLNWNGSNVEPLPLQLNVEITLQQLTSLKLTLKRTLLERIKCARGRKLRKPQDRPNNGAELKGGSRITRRLYRTVGGERSRNVK